MKDKKVMAAVPVVCGLLSYVFYGIYYYCSTKAMYQFDNVVLAGPALALAGFIVSIINTRDKEEYKGLWLAGMILCASSLILCVLGILFLIFVVGYYIGGQLF